MVWKKMMFEEFRDGCARQSLVCNGMILAISVSSCCWKPSIKFLLERIYGWKMLFEEFHNGS